MFKHTRINYYRPIKINVMTVPSQDIAHIFTETPERYHLYRNRYTKYLNHYEYIDPGKWCTMCV